MGMSTGGETTVLGLSSKAITCNMSRVDPGFFKGWWLVCKCFRINRACPQKVAICELEPIADFYFLIFGGRLGSG